MMLFEDFGTHTPISTIFYVDFQMVKFLLKGYSLCCTPSPKNLIKVTSIYEKKNNLLLQITNYKTVVMTTIYISQDDKI